MSRRASKIAKKIEKKRKAGIRSTRMMYRLKQISREDRDELVDFWKKADGETVLRAMGKARKDALVATGRLPPEEAEEGGRE